MSICGGLYQYLTQNSGAAAVQALLAAPVTGSIYFSRAEKQAARPSAVLHLVDGRPAGETLDGVSNLIDGEFQFDSYADDQPTARALSEAIRDALKNFGGTLNDGTTIQFYSVSLDTDDPYELGGGGYIDRSVLRLRAFYSESGGFTPSGGGVTLYSLTPAPNGSVTVFTAPVAISASAIVARNGLIQTAGVDYGYSGDQVTFFVAPGATDTLALYQ